MTEDKQRMIHIRIKEEIHKELRKAAAEYDLTIQDIVSEAVEERVEALEEALLLDREQELLKLEAEKIKGEVIKEQKSLKINIEHDIDTEYAAGVTHDYGSTVFQKLDSILEGIESIQCELRNISVKLSQNDQD